MRRLLDERGRIGTVGPSDVAEMLDRMHHATVPRVRLVPCGARPSCELSHQTRHALPLRVQGADVDTPIEGASRYDRWPWPTHPISSTGPTPSAAASDRPRPDPAHRRCRRHRPPGHGVAHHVPPRVGRARSVHQRELVDPQSAARVLEQFRGSDARINMIVTAQRRRRLDFLGPLADRFLVVLRPRPGLRARRWASPSSPPSCSPGSTASLPRRHRVGTRAEWEAVADAIADVTKWTSIPRARRPVTRAPFRGSPALG